MRASEDVDPVDVRARSQLAALLPAIGVGPGVAASIRRTYDAVAAHRPPASPYRAPRWSGVGDDSSPVEWSLAFRPGAVDLRLLVEAQHEPADPPGYWAAGRALTGMLVDELRADAGRLAAIEDLYAPAAGADPAFVLWHGIEWRDPAGPGGSRPPRVKLYLNPAAADPDPQAVTAVVAETYRRLGFADAWSAVAPLLADAPPSHVSIDLDPSPGARFKLYVRVRDLRGAVAAYALGSGGADTDVHDVVAALTGREPAPDERLPRPGFVVLHHTEPGAAPPERTVLNLHVPSLVEDDRTALDRIAALLSRHGLPADRHAAAVTALARDSFMGTSPFRAAGPDPLGGQRRLQSYLSFQREPAGARITTYFGLRAFAARFGWRADDPTTMWSPPPPPLPPSSP